MHKALNPAGKFNVDFALPVLLALLINAPLLSGKVWPAGDSKSAFDNFFFFYNEVYFHGRIPLWIPFGFWGVKASFQHLFTSPAHYLFFYLGALLRQPDTLLMFKLGMLAEQLMLLTGSYHLARVLFRSRLAILFVSACVVMSSVWIYQVMLNFRIYYLIPAVLAFGYSWFRSGRPHYLWCAGIVLVFSLLGNAAYHLALYLVLLGIFFASEAVSVKVKPKFLLERSWKNGGTFLLALVSGVLLAIVMMSAMRGTEIISPGRDAVTRATSIDLFLSYGGKIGLKKFLGLFYGGPVPGKPTIDLSNFTRQQYTGDSALYAGAVSLLFFLYALRRSRRREFAAVGLSFAFLFAFSLADTSFVARASYRWVPAMELYRHIGLVHGLLKLFLILGAGFGIEAYLRDVQESPAVRRSASRTLLMTAVLLAAVFMLMDRQINTEGRLYPRVWTGFYPLAWSSPVIVGVIAAYRRLPGYAAVLASLIMLLLDLGTHQVLMTSTAPRWPAGLSEAAHVRPAEFYKERKQELPDVPVKQKAYRVTAGTPKAYTMAYNFIQHDPCIPIFRTDYLSSGAADFFRFRGGKAPDKPPLDDPSFPVFLGCESPKLLFFEPGSVRYAGSYEEAGRLWSEADGSSLIPVIEAAPPADVSSPSVRRGGVKGFARVEEFSANRVRFSGRVDNESGAWLVYSDGYDPGWQARLNGQAAVIHRANLAFKAFRVEPGDFTLELIYGRGIPARAGGLLGMLAALFSAVFFLIFFRTLFSPVFRTEAGDFFP